jgi:hypothetical protein
VLVPSFSGSNEFFFYTVHFGNIFLPQPYHEKWIFLQGVPVDGYLQWTISDNWEWADGYCPKFGLVDVDRAGNLTRIPRPSYYLYQQVTFQLFQGHH